LPSGVRCAFFASRGATVLILDDHSAGEEDLQLRSIAHGVVLLEHMPFAYGRARRSGRGRIRPKRRVGA
jgi:circadian clock protein KaiC